MFCRLMIFGFIVFSSFDCFAMNPGSQSGRHASSSFSSSSTSGKTTVFDGPTFEEFLNGASASSTSSKSAPASLPAFPKGTHVIGRSGGELNNNPRITTTTIHSFSVEPAGIALIVGLAWAAYAGRQVANKISDSEWQTLSKLGSAKKIISGIPQEMCYEVRQAVSSMLIYLRQVSSQN